MSEPVRVPSELVEKAQAELADDLERLVNTVRDGDEATKDAAILRIVDSFSDLIAHVEVLLDELRQRGYEAAGRLH
jgi:hypothetical protein